MDFRKIKKGMKVGFHGHAGLQIGEVIKVYNQCGIKYIDIQWFKANFSPFIPHISMEDRTTITHNFDWKTIPYKDDFDELINGL